MPTTRLAAIMFTDIVGYTAMMQSNRDSAMTAVKKFEAVLKDRIASHSGELLQTYGDGSLSIFDSASAAVSCAKEIQEAIRGKVPLRIGIHMGEITIDGEHTFGDGVNIASRIESIGIDGAILMSSSIRQQIKNKPEFQLESLGKFSFKNVIEPMSVYALGNEGLSVPKPSEMKGKGEQVNNRETKSLFRIASLGFLTMVLGAGLFWMFAHTPTETEKLEEIKASRIAILPFENKTNDPKFDVLGDMAADHVIQGMMNLDDVKVVSYTTIRENLKDTDAQSEDFGARTGAQKLIRGNIYKEGDSLSIQSQIIDLKSGDVDMVLPEIKAAYDEPRKLVGELRSRMLGFFVAKKTRFSSSAIVTDQIAPKLEAFEAYRAFSEFWNVDDLKSRELLEKAISLDSTFFSPYQFYVWSWSNLGIWGKADSVVKLIDRRFPSLHGYEKLYQDFNKKLVSGKAHEAMPEIEGIFKKDPRHLFNNMLMGLMCIYRNFPQKGIEAMSHIEAANYPNDYVAHTWWHGVYAFHLIRKDKDTEARKVLGYVPMDTYATNAITSRSLYHAKRGEADSISYFLNELEKYEYPPNVLGWRKHSAANYLAIYGDSLSQIALAEELIADFEEGLLHDSTLLFEALVHARQYDEALKLGEYLVENGINSSWSLARMGWIHAQEGRKDKARQFLDELVEQFPRAYYQQAIIQTALGEKAEAVENLVKAFDAGRFYYNTSYDFEYAFLPLREYQPFVEKFMKPKG
ncbi:MAG: adenylate/guanylate cyclase domain-containing protein [Bacteroidia bacterium]|nr:adenylate/guanylate cyclase domain-containing protein [Bacteroidia bacterium]